MSNFKFHFYGQMVNLTKLYESAKVNFNASHPTVFLSNYQGDFLSKISESGDMLITKQAALDYANSISIDLEVEL